MIQWRLRHRGEVAMKAKSFSPVPIALREARVLPSFQRAIFDAAARTGSTVTEVVLEAAGRELRSRGLPVEGVFQPGDLGEVRHVA